MKFLPPNTSRGLQEDQLQECVGGGEHVCVRVKGGERGVWVEVRRERVREAS